jgi:predicted extracellular nuclease
MPRRLVLTTILIAALLVPAAARAASPDITISQVYGGGGNSGATYTNDFIELYNRSSAPVPVDGWSVQYASAAGSSWQVTPLAGTIAPGGHYLVQESAGTGGTTPLPQPDATGSIAMSGTSGKVALVTSTTPLVCPPDCASHSRDFVGYGAANDSETAPAPGLSNTTAAKRAAAGATDTDDNAADFTAGPPEPRNSGGPLIESSDPEDGASGVPVAQTITVTFSEPADAPAFALECGDEPQPATTSGGGDTYTIDPDADLPRGEDCTLTAEVGTRSDSVSFTTIGVEGLQIHDIQGAVHRSPYEGQAVAGVPGIVTAVSSNGFWMQDDQPDSSSATSEGVFVFRGTAEVGRRVRVSGRVAEFRAAAENLTLTEITSPTVVQDGSGTIAPTLLGPSGRRPPQRVIEDDAMGDVEMGNVLFDPQEDGIDFHESLEGMYVEIERPEAVGPRNNFGEVAVVADGAASVRSVRDGVVVRADDFNPERFILDDVLADTPAVNTGDGFTSPVRAVVDYSFGNFKYFVTSEPGRRDDGLRREVTARPDSRQIAIASMNVENLSAADFAEDPEKVQKLVDIVVDNLRSPDILAVEEMQDNDGAPAEGDSDATATFESFVAAIEAAGGPTYRYRQIDPEPGQDGGEPGGNIRVGFLFRPDRQVEFVDRPGGTATTATSDDASRRGAQLTYSPGRIDPTNPAFENSRKPLAGEFKFRGKQLFVIANHFNSKGGDDPLFGRRQPPVRSSEEQRHQQATVVRDFVRSLLRADWKAPVVVLGDFNDFEFSETLRILESGGLGNLMRTLPQSERYSYVFDGNSQALDQILVSLGTLGWLPAYDSVHVNAEFSDQASDHDPQIARLTLP